MIKLIKVIKGETLIDGTGIEPVEGAVVVIDESRIANVGRKGEVAIPSGAKVFDVSGKTVMPGLIETFVDAEALITDPCCGMCFGLTSPLAGDDVCVASSTNNVLGRMGGRNAQIYLASPATVAASCIEGKLADPRNYL